MNNRQRRFFDNKRKTQSISALSLLFHRLLGGIPKEIQIYILLKDKKNARLFYKKSLHNHELP